MSNPQSDTAMIEVKNPQSAKRKTTIDILRLLYAEHWGKPYTKTDATGNQDRFFEQGLLAELFPTLEEYIVIRHEYKLAYIYIANANQENLRVSKKPAKFVLTGQPGIGKSSFLAYVLVHRLQHKLPTAVERAGSGFVLFSDEGVDMFEASEKPRIENLWALSDSTPETVIPCVALRDSRAVLIQATSPAQHRWKEWKKQTCAFLYIMDVWTTDEIRAVLVKLKLNDAHGVEIMNKYGPCARTVVLLVKRPSEEASFMATIAKAASHVAAKVSDVMEAFDNLDISSQNTPSSLLFFRPVSRDERNLSKTYIPTAYFVTTLAHALIKRKNAEQNMFFSLMSQQASTRSAARWIFENFMHVRLTTVSGEPTLCQRVDTNRETLQIPTTDNFITGTLDDLSESTVPCYWRPVASSPSGIDSVIRFQGETWVFQTTFERRRGTTSGGLSSVIQAIGRARVGQMRLVIVGSSLDDAWEVAWKMKDISTDVPVYACELTMSGANGTHLVACMQGSYPYDPNSMEVDTQQE
ncbi:hypothetical protein BC835DRAFT_1519787 [Cytidiella melzeri]|nr:hypothetical protein BC835DRAFT_1519787 [Cytidiella melzeri]